MDLAQHYLESSIVEFTKLKKLADKALAQVSDSDFLFRLDDESNSIAQIIQHVSGNMISRWTDFLMTDGEKPTRNRDGEFEEKMITKEEIVANWEQGWQVFFDTLHLLTPEDMLKTVTIRNEPHTVVQAFTRQLTHYGQHIGQIIFLCKHLASSHWQTLSIAKGKSNDFNNEMMKNNS